MALSAAFSFSSCENNESFSALEENQEQQKRVVTIQITLPKQDTRVVLNDSFRITGWKAGDKVSLYKLDVQEVNYHASLAGPYIFECKDPDNGWFECTDENTPDPTELNYAVYQGIMSTDGGPQIVFYPLHHYSDNIEDVIMMAAQKDDDGKYHMNLYGSILKVNNQLSSAIDVATTAPFVWNGHLLGVDYSLPSFSKSTNPHEGYEAWPVKSAKFSTNKFSLTQGISYVYASTHGFAGLFDENGVEIVPSRELDEGVNKIYNVTVNSIPTRKGRGTAPIAFMNPENMNAAENDADIMWVQLWEGGPKFADRNVNGVPFSWGTNHAWSSYLVKATCGSQWSLLSKSDIEGLLDPEKCTCEWTETANTNTYGYVFTGKGEYSNNSIFFPIYEGYGDGSEYYANPETVIGSYWTSTENDASSAWAFIFDKRNLSLQTEDKSSEFLYRPVLRSGEEPSEPEYVIIGGKKWATKNLGATTIAGSPATCYGDYYAWGETQPRYTGLDISGANSVSATGWKSGYSTGYSAGNCPAYTGATLDAEHDAATKALGPEWHIPTSVDFLELYIACGGEDGTGFYVGSIPEGDENTRAKGIYWCNSYFGVPGCLFSDGNNQLFFPSAGGANSGDLNEDPDGTIFNVWQGMYWSSTLSTLYADDPSFANNYANTFVFNSYMVATQGPNRRCFGLTIRPVSDL